MPNEDWRELRTPWGQEVLISGRLAISEDDRGDLFIHPAGDLDAPPSGHMPGSGYVFDLITRTPPDSSSEARDPEDNLEEFDALSVEDLGYLREQVDAAKKTGRAVVANLGIVPFVDIGIVQAPSLKHPKGIRDMAQLLVATLTEQDYLHEVFTRQSDLALRNLAAAYDVLGDDIDVLYLCGYDFGTQESLFCSLDTFDSLFAPYYRKVTGWIHTNTTWKIFKHTDGAIEPLMSRLADVGIDILNPIQWSAAGMDPEHLKTTYGKDLVFWGGGVDTQHTLPHAAPEEVREEVLQMCEIFSRDGGYVFNSVHNLVAKSPIDNLVAIFEAVKEFNGT